MFISSTNPPLDFASETLKPSISSGIAAQLKKVGASLIADITSRLLLRAYTSFYHSFKR